MWQDYAPAMRSNRVFAIYQTLLGWETHYAGVYKVNITWNQRASQPKANPIPKKQLKTAKIVLLIIQFSLNFRGLGCDLGL